MRELSLLSLPLQAAAAEARINFAALRRLTRVDLALASDLSVQFPLEWFPLPALTVLDMRGFSLSDHDLERVIAEPAMLRGFGFTPTSDRQAERAQEGLEPGVSVALHGYGTAPLGRILDHTHGDSPESFSIALDLADATDTESNVDAETLLRDAIERHAPEIAPHLRYDTESSAIWVRAEKRQHLERAQAVAAHLGRRPL